LGLFDQVDNTLYIHCLVYKVYFDGCSAIVDAVGISTPCFRQLTLFRSFFVRSLILAGKQYVKTKQAVIRLKITA